jgi:hypothetical protein
MLGHPMHNQDLVRVSNAFNNSKSSLTSPRFWERNVLALRSGTFIACLSHIAAKAALLADTSAMSATVAGSSSMALPMILRIPPTKNFANASQSAHSCFAAGSKNSIRRMLSETSNCSKISRADSFRASMSLR